MWPTRRECSWTYEPVADKATVTRTFTNEHGLAVTAEVVISTADVSVVLRGPDSITENIITRESEELCAVLAAALRVSVSRPSSV